MYAFFEGVRSGEVDNVGFSAFAQGDTAWDRVFAVAVGYVCVGVIIGVWLARDSNDRDGWAGTLREIFRQNLMVVKVRSFELSHLVGKELTTSKDVENSYQLTDRFVTFQTHQLAFFMAIELLVFPFGCGVLLSISSLPLASLNAAQNRVAFALNSPIIAILLHWLAGTMVCAITSAVVKL